jgi:hypothetical protein
MMPDATPFIDATTADGYLLVLNRPASCGHPAVAGARWKFIERITLALCS